MPTYRVNWRLRGLKGTKELRPGQTVKLTATEAARFVARGVLSPCTEVDAGPDTPITIDHARFLEERGYSVKTVEQAEAFVAKLAPRERMGFIAEAAAWIIAQKNAGQPVDLSAMTKAQLVEYGHAQLRLSLDITRTKADLLAAIADAASQ